MNESTPLTANPQISEVGVMYAIPNGAASSRMRRKKLMRYQLCLGLSFFSIIIAALLIVYALNGFGDSNDNELPTLTLANKPSESTMLKTNEATTQLMTKPLPDELPSKWHWNERYTNKFSEPAINGGIKALGDREIMEEGLQPIAKNSPAFRHFRSLSSNAEARKQSKRGYIENESTKIVAQLLNFTKDGKRSNIGHGPVIKLLDPTLNFTCDFNEKYRRATGICNNKKNPRTYGAALTPYRRMVQPDYADGISQPRGSHTTNVSLPSARRVSLQMHRSSYETDSNFTVMLAVFGQFLDHDITATSLSVAQEGESINCCTMPLSQHPECFPVEIANDDPYYKQFNVTCMNFVRSAPASTGHFGPRQQLNQATAFIDGSVVYGSTELRQEHLRTGRNGLLRMYVAKDNIELLPLSTNPNDGCNREQMLQEGKYCFESGDDRGNENLLLTSMHLLWARHHNYLARQLQTINPEWNDETVFQESRKILAAQMAHITYNEFLPILLGRDLMVKKDLLPRIDDLQAPDTYNIETNPTIANCFASASFRFAHTLLPSLFRITRDNSTSDAIELHKILFNPFSLWKNRGFEDALLTAIETFVQRVDRFFSIEVTQKLFEDSPEARHRLPLCGLDLVSLNIQRGRDHGLPSYSVFRKHCRLPPVDTWEQMSKALDPDSLLSIQQIYSSPQDVDMYTGALSEPPLSGGAMFGPLLSCLISDQFLRLKQGDSHWYERKVGPQKFTKDQLQEIYKTTLAKVMCINSNSLQKIREHVMERRDPQISKYIDCTKDGDFFNFTVWKVTLQPPQIHRNQLAQFMSAVRVISKPQK